MENKRLKGLYQVYSNIAEIAYQKGLTHVILSPGSRSAVLALSFIRHPHIQTITIVDERTAAFKALGMANALNRPVGLICTSGTAALNYGPGLAEAYWQGVPLLAFTADRPPEWIDNGENQTIYQENLFRNQVKGAYSLPLSFEEDNEAWYAYTIINDALEQANGIASGPVHINAPVREPLYLDQAEMPEPNPDLNAIDNIQGKHILSEVEQYELIEALKQNDRIAIIAGQNKFSSKTLNKLQDFAERTKAIIIADPASNCHAIEEALSLSDLLFTKAYKENSNLLQPDLLITFGDSIVSKSLKQYLRHFKPKAQWHVTASGYAPDLFQSLTRVVELKPGTFFNQVGGNFWPKSQNDYKNHLQSLEAELKTHWLPKLEDQSQFSELRVFKHCINNLPEKATIHLGNSQPIRHAQIAGLETHESELNLTVQANRGTSGIDGSLSAAVGYAHLTTEPLLAFIGDLAFLYDRNALWQETLPSNLRIIVFNNNGGGIFRNLPGAKDQPELETYFASPHTLNFSQTAQQHQCHYYYANDWETLNKGLSMIHDSLDVPLILEVQFDQATNDHDLSALKEAALNQISLA